MSYIYLIYFQQILNNQFEIVAFHKAACSLQWTIYFNCGPTIQVQTNLYRIQSFLLLNLFHLYLLNHLGFYFASHNHVLGYLPTLCLSRQVSSLQTLLLTDLPFPFF